MFQLQNTQDTSWGWFWILKIASKVWVLKQTSLQCCAVLPTWQCCRNSFVWWMYEIYLANRLSHAWLHFVTALASLLTDHRNVKSSNSCQVQVFQDNFWAHFWLIRVPPSWIDDYPGKDLKLCKVAPLSCRIFWACLSMSWRPRYGLCAEVFPIPKIFCCSLLFNDCFIRFGFTLSSSPVSWSSNGVGSSRSTFFIIFLQAGAKFCFFPASLMSWTFPTSNTCFVCFHWECWVSCGHSKLPRKHWKILLMYLVVRVFHVFQFWEWRTKFPSACEVGIFSLIIFCLVLILLHQFPGCLRMIFSSTRLRISHFWIWVCLHSCLDACATSFLFFIGILRFDQGLEIREEISSLLCSRSIRHRFAFVVEEPSFKVICWTSFWPDASVSHLIVR